jgi:hypothetical protein
MGDEQVYAGCGRTFVLDRLTGPGVPVLAGRLT